MKIVKTKIFSKFFKLFNINNNAITIGNWVFIHPDLASKKDIIQHEITHVQQFKKEGVFFWIKYIFNKEHRLNYECEAFAVQMRYLFNQGDSMSLQDLFVRFATDIFNNYNLKKYSFNEIKSRLELAYRSLK